MMIKYNDFRRRSKGREDTFSGGEMGDVKMSSAQIKKVLTPEHIRELRRAFQVFDKEKQGCIRKPDLRKMLGTIGYNPGKENLFPGDTNLKSCLTGTTDPFFCK